MVGWHGWSGAHFAFDAHVMTKFNDFISGVIIFTYYLLGNVKLYTIQDPRNFPYFGSNDVRNVTTTVGHNAYLHCEVEQLGDKAVSWIRKRDLHILTVGVLSYTSDQRFQIIRSEKSSNWTLQIKYPQLRDSGIYECQVNTEPKMSIPFTLNVIESKAKILGSTDLHVRQGSSVTFTCTVTQGPHDLNTVFWYKESQLLQPANSGERPPRISIQNTWTDAFTSHLYIASVNWSDSGKYSCVPTAAAPAHTNLYVITGEHPAAMHHGNRNGSSSHQSGVSFLPIMAVLLLLRLRR